MTHPPTTTCVRCGGTLHQQPCGCWTGPDHTRGCPGESRTYEDRTRLHQPGGGTQPERCPGTPQETR